MKMKLAFVAICSMLISAAAAQSFAEMMVMSNLFGGGSRGGGSGGSNPFASLFGSSTQGAATGRGSLSSLGSLGSSSSAISTNPFSTLLGGGGGAAAAGGAGMSRMGRTMGGALMLGGADMMDIYQCGFLRMGLSECLIMQQNM